MTKDEYQIITGNVSFENSVNAREVAGWFAITEKIRDIISDTVIDDGNSIEINGSKVFEDDFVADSLTVDGNLGVREINRVNIKEFNDSIVRRYHENTITGSLIFSQNVRIEKLHVDDPDLNASIGAAVRNVDTLPDNVFFENLVVTGNVYLENLDGIDFDRFVKNRVTLSGNHNIWCNMRFNKLVTVTGKITVLQIKFYNNVIKM